MSLVRSRALAGIAALGAAALIAGCGGGSGSPSADDFRQQADAICADGNSRLEALAAPTANDQVLGFLQSGLAIQREEIQKLKALEPPSDLAGTFGEATALLDQQVEKLADAADRIDKGEDPQAVVADLDQEMTSLQTQARGKAKELGLTVCGAGDTATSTTSTTATAPDTTATTPGAPATDTTGSTSTAPAGDATAFVADTKAAAAALGRFLTILEGVSNLQDLQAKAPEASKAFDDFDAAIGRLDTYTLDDPALERKRAGLVRTGPAVSDTLRKFVAAASAGDLAALGDLAPQVAKAVADFRAAAEG